MKKNFILSRGIRLIRAAQQRVRTTQWGLLVQWTTSLTGCTQEQKPYGVALPQRWGSADRPWTYDACAIHLKHRSAACARRAAACAGCGCLQQKWRWHGKERYGRRALPFEIPACARRAVACAGCGCLLKKWWWRGKEISGRRPLPFEIPALSRFGPPARRAAEGAC